MWKNFFYFSGSQRAGILLLVVLILLASLTDYFLPLFFEKESEQSDAVFLAEIDDFKKSLWSIDSLREAERFRKYKANYPSYYHSPKTGFSTSPDKTSGLFAFNPNELDSSGFVKLGLKPYVASNILKFRKKGGRFKNRESFAKIYGIPEEKYNELAAYINIPDKDSLLLKDINTNDALELKKTLKVELNTADTNELMQIKGIGRGYAIGIIKFRKQTGGFVRIEQLREVYGMTPENFEKISPFCTINPKNVKKINVNTASVDKLKSHPYLNFYQAKQIYELRRKKGKLSGLAELAKLSEINELTLEKIAVYLNFE
jgi:competence ComEA-like helix-hairpin-helix protein